MFSKRVLINIKKCHTDLLQEDVLGRCIMYKMYDLVNSVSTFLVASV